ncbi:uncharacterized protein LOC135834691 isoform X2 [Planococcus citri]|uniref:uncharacterized protein LOC135834691 isoform X2 n=1 Tax=Planococcus citri TaxID=170843 RepID=UPI0031F7304F
MAQVKYFCHRYSLKSGSFFILILNLILGITFLVAEIISLKGNFTFASVTVLVFVLLGIVSCVIGLVGIYMKIANLLAPTLCLEIIYVIVSGVAFIIFLFSGKFSVSELLDDFASQHYGVFVILFLMGLGLSIYFLIVLYSYYMKELKEGTPARRSDTES